MLQHDDLLPMMGCASLGGDAKTQLMFTSSGGVKLQPSRLGVDMATGMHLLCTAKHLLEQQFACPPLYCIKELCKQSGHVMSLCNTLV